MSFLSSVQVPARRCLPHFQGAAVKCLLKIYIRNLQINYLVYSLVSPCRCPPGGPCPIKVQQCGGVNQPVVDCSARGGSCVSLFMGILQPQCGFACGAGRNRLYGRYGQWLKAAVWNWGRRGNCCSWASCSRSAAPCAARGGTGWNGGRLPYRVNGERVKLYTSALQPQCDIPCGAGQKKLYGRSERLWGKFPYKSRGDGQVWTVWKRLCSRYRSRIPVRGRATRCMSNSHRTRFPGAVLY